MEEVWEKRKTVIREYGKLFDIARILVQEPYSPTGPEYGMAADAD